MGKRERERKKVDSERVQWRVPMTDAEVERIEQESLDPALNKGTTKAAYMRQLLLAPLDPAAAPPHFEEIEAAQEIDRPRRPSVRLKPEELRALKEEAARLGIHPDRYSRWRLLGITK